MLEFNSILSEYGEFKQSVSIKSLTSFSIGGMADYVVYPYTLDKFIALINFLNIKQIPYKIWGMGSNILASDDSYHGLIIKLNQILNKIEISGNHVLVGAGVSLINLAYKTYQSGLSGFEYASGIPGSVGGAIFMNAGAYKHDTYEILKRVLVLKDNKLSWINKNEIFHTYRHTSFSEHKDWIILEAEFELTYGSKLDIEKIVSDRRLRRIQSQPLNLPSAGSVFRNPEDRLAWQILDEVGLRGKQIGGAMFSEKHSNFIVNFNNASAQDVLDLIQLAQKLIKQKFGFDMNPEIELFNWRQND